MQQRSSLGWTIVAVLLGLCWFMVTSPIVFTYALCALGIAFAVACVAMVVYVIWWCVHNSLAPATRVEATVLRKRSKEWDVSLVGDTPESSAAKLAMMGRHPADAARLWSRSMRSRAVPEVQIAQGAQYIMVFCFNGKEEEFDVPESTFARACEGDTGLLSFKGEKFVCFIPNIKR